MVGQVEAAMTSNAGVRIAYLNGVETRAGFPGTIFTRGERGGRGERRTYVKLGDVVRAKVASTLNGMNQLSVDEPHLGVLASHVQRVRHAAPPRGRQGEVHGVRQRGRAEVRRRLREPNIQP